ncbi:MAG TPA: hypothetical protein VGO52_17095, partial [Hyphomonadaceae bacterium]|nr:hypothetical protein [Hyphomonadaceae bacterium]
SAWNGKKSEANLAAVRPYAEAGEAKAMRAMMDGYVQLAKSSGGRGQSASLAKPEQGLTSLAAIWAMQIYRIAGVEKDRKLVAALAPCLVNQPDYVPEPAGIYVVSSISGDIDCGFDTDGGQMAQAAFQLQELIRTKREPGGTPQVKFIERPVVNQAAVDATHFASALEAYRARNGYDKTSETKAETKWILAYVGTEPARQAEFDRIRFEVELQHMKQPGYPKDAAYYKAYSETPAGKARLAELAAVKQAEADRRGYNARNFNIANANETNRYSSMQAAFDAGGQSAIAWYDKFGASLKPGEISIYQWCDKGVPKACDAAGAQRDLFKLQADLQQAKDDAKLFVPDSGGGGSPGETLAQREARVSRENCARADLGASIACKRD